MSERDRYGLHTREREREMFVVDLRVVSYLWDKD